VQKRYIVENGGDLKEASECKSSVNKVVLVTDNNVCFVLLCDAAAMRTTIFPENCFDSSLHSVKGKKREEVYRVQEAIETLAFFHANVCSAWFMAYNFLHVVYADLCDLHANLR